MVLGSGDSAGLVIPAAIAVAAALVGWWLCVLVDVLSWPRSTWTAAGLSKPRWVTRVLLLGWLGAVLYIRSARRDLKAAYRSLRWG